MKESFILQNIYIKYGHSQDLLPLHETYIYIYIYIYKGHYTLTMTCGKLRKNLGCVADYQGLI
jgi:hypothetical protein